MEIRQPKVGEAVVFVDARAQSHAALLTAVHGTANEHGGPAVNLVFVTDDTEKRDPYGQQIERETSVVHRKHQSADGMYWRFAEDQD